MYISIPSTYILVTSSIVFLTYVNQTAVTSIAMVPWTTHTGTLKRDGANTMNAAYEERRTAYQV